MQPPPNFAKEFRELLETEIPYQKAIKLATQATQTEDWDDVTRAGELALRLKPGDEKAKQILSACPKILLPKLKTAPHELARAHTSRLDFSSDGKILLAYITWSATSENGDSWKVFGWDARTRAEVEVPNGDTRGCPYTLVPGRDIIAKRATVQGRNYGDLSLESLFEANKGARTLGLMDWMGVGNFGFDEDGQILWTQVGSFSVKQTERLGLLPAANELGLVFREFTYDGLKESAVLWNFEDLKPIGIFGLNAHDNEHYTIANVLITPDKKIAVLFERGGQLYGQQERPDVLSAWDIATHKLLATSEGKRGSLSVWGIAPDRKRVIVWKDGKFWHWNWEANAYESPVELPTTGNHIIQFNRWCEYVADRSTTDPYIRIWEFKSGKVLCKFKEPAGTSVQAMAFSPDGSYLASALDRRDDSLSLWKIPEDIRPLIAKRQAPPPETKP
jgi:hypothetical protein